MTIQFKSTIVRLSLAAAFAMPGAANADVVKIAFIDPLSGTFAPVGQNMLKSFQYIAEKANAEKWAGENTFEIVAFDNKGSPMESLAALKSAIDQGYRYVMQGAGSGAALALAEAVSKHNERNPGKEVVYINFAAIDPDMTNSKCSFWHFRFDANSDQKMEALTSHIEKNPNVKKVYIIGQNYALGHQVARAAKDYLKRKRPDIQIVGDDLHPIGQVKDFSPYVAKMKAAGADTVITGNWGADLALLIKAAKDANFDANFYTYYGNSTNVPTAMGASGIDRVKVVSIWNANNEKFAGKDIVDGFKKKYNDDYLLVASYSSLSMLGKAFRTARTTDPVKVAFAMEGMKLASLNGEVEMRKQDHQLQQPLYIATWTRVNGKDVKIDQENTGYGWKTDVKLDTHVGVQPTSCQMKRPS
ncbi:branched-chain amino acid ABC transporter substrate-binding protein [Noviherbaspirillum denitrificans]|uniref:Branched-chain amino acid ABC transporter substrate-binding protein n=2 Tax=Noviherbaspirillum denitrificans TaxID=1968433 RepID=A0A254T6M3_9BURK|nr:branched-chain amino acid ABC transporter substrate-binding protein [Noviherbaspirillum denitrificans]OWW18319.1 branched-chain amino acid ABC transporter substrate-binding protein [Noviherbaspirillum denitrificans]